MQNLQHDGQNDMKSVPKIETAHWFLHKQKVKVAKHKVRGLGVFVCVGTIEHQ